MTEEELKTIENGCAEIWRREKLLLFSLLVCALFGLLVCIPLALAWGGYVALAAAIIPIALYVRVLLWVESTPCPKCGRPYGGVKVRRQCSNCKLNIKKPVPVDYSISFNPIHYEPLDDRSPE
jgi:hypothetical protein